MPLAGNEIPVPEGPLYLKASVREASLQFFWSDDGEQWFAVGDALDASLLSDEAGKGEGANFTGAFVGVCCQDLTGQRQPADFAWFTYTAVDTQVSAQGGLS
ncbi:MAG: beta-xylosidase family glycoside hydrolase, partial [bacterium]